MLPITPRLLTRIEYWLQFDTPKYLERVRWGRNSIVENKRPERTRVFCLPIQST